MRTTSKAFTIQIQDHILKILSEDYTTDPKQQLEEVVKGFKNWYGPYEQKRIPNIQTAYIDWWLGLPSSINVETYYHEIHEIMKSWWENAGETYKNTDQTKESQLYYYLVYREFRNLCKKYDVATY